MCEQRACLGSAGLGVRALCGIPLADHCWVRAQPIRPARSSVARRCSSCRGSRVGVRGCSRTCSRTVWVGGSNCATRRAGVLRQLRAAPPPTRRLGEVWHSLAGSGLALSEATLVRQIRDDTRSCNGTAGGIRCCAWPHALSTSRERTAFNAARLGRIGAPRRRLVFYQLAVTSRGKRSLSVQPTGKSTKAWQCNDQRSTCSCSDPAVLSHLPRPSPPSVRRARHRSPDTGRQRLTPCARVLFGVR